MKLAEALQERADLNNRIEQIRHRLTINAIVQEGENPPENPQELLKELNSCIEKLEFLISKINLANCRTMVDGKSLTELLAQRDCLSIKIISYRELVDSASRVAQRATKREIKIQSTVDVKEMQKQIDQLSKELRILDNKIQETNWTTEL